MKWQINNIPIFCTHFNSFDTNYFIKVDFIVLYINYIATTFFFFDNKLLSSSEKILGHRWQ